MASQYGGDPNEELDQQTLRKAMIAAPSAPIVAPDVAPAPSGPKARYLEGDAAKMADPSHALKSPKYAWFQGADSYGKDTAGRLKALQEDTRPEVANFYKGWTANKDKISYAGDPNALDPRWDGVKSVDVYGGYNGPEDQGGIRWGVDDPNQPQEYRGEMPASNPNGVAVSNPNAVPGGGDADLYARILKEIQGQSYAPSTNNLDGETLRKAMGR